MLGLRAGDPQRPARTVEAAALGEGPGLPERGPGRVVDDFTLPVQDHA